MKLVSELQLRMGTRDIAGVISLANRFELDVHLFRLIREEEKKSLYLLRVIYEHKERFDSLLREIGESQDKYIVESVTDLLEEQTRGGLLRVASKFPLENVTDFEIRLLGATELIVQKIHEGNGHPYSGISRNIAIISAFRTQEDAKIDRVLETYARAEEDSIIINMFTGLNAYPLVLRFDHEEDLIKTLQRISPSFSALKIFYVDEIDSGFYDQITSDVPVPVISELYDIIPLCLLTVLTRLMAKYKLKSRELTIGFIGADTSVMRLTRIMMKSDFYRVLGNDPSERAQLVFEKQGGLATTNENILVNADIIFLMKNIFSPDELRKIRPGVMLISTLPRETVDPGILSERGVREYIQTGKKDFSAISPGVIMGAVASGIIHIDDARLVGLARKLGSFIDDAMIFPDVFSDVHKKITELIEKM